MSIPKFTLWGVLLFSMLIISCGGEVDIEIPVDLVGDTARGESLYYEAMLGEIEAPGCITCHTLEEGFTLVGPSHAGIATRAMAAGDGRSAEEFLFESILIPDAVIPEGFTPGVMYQNYARDLTQQEVADLVSYMMTLE